MRREQRRVKLVVLVVGVQDRLLGLVVVLVQQGRGNLVGQVRHTMEGAVVVMPPQVHLEHLQLVSVGTVGCFTLQENQRIMLVAEGVVLLMVTPFDLGVSVVGELVGDEHQMRYVPQEPTISVVEEELVVI